MAADRQGFLPAPTLWIETDTVAAEGPNEITRLGTGHMADGHIVRTRDIIATTRIIITFSTSQGDVAAPRRRNRRRWQATALHGACGHAQGDNILGYLI